MNSHVWKFGLRLEMQFVFCSWGFVSIWCLIQNNLQIYQSIFHSFVSIFGAHLIFILCLLMLPKFHLKLNKIFSWGLLFMLLNGFWLHWTVFVNFLFFQLPRKMSSFVLVQKLSKCASSWYERVKTKKCCDTAFYFSFKFQVLVSDFCFAKSVWNAFLSVLSGFKLAADLDTFS